MPCTSCSIPFVNSSLVEHRKQVRYSLRIPVLFAWHSGPQQYIEDGRTENISTHGIYISCDPKCCPPLGKRLSMTMVLPPAEGKSPGATLKGEGRVVRTETTPGKWSGFAAKTYFKIDLR